MAESDRGLWASHGEMRSFSVGRKFRKDGRMLEGEKAAQHIRVTSRGSKDLEEGIGGPESLVGCCRKRRPSIPASLAAWLAGWPAGRSILPWLRRATWRRKKRRRVGGGWLAGWLAREDWWRGGCSYSGYTREG